jgi:hypothetical protein
MPRNATSVAVVVFLVYFLAAPALPAMEKLYVQDPVVIDQDASIDPAVRESCKLDARLPFFLYQKINSKFEVIPAKTPEDAADAKMLTLVIQNVQGDASSGAWFGRKGVTLRGTLRESGKVIGSFNARRRSTGGALGPFKDGCAIFERCAKELADDVAEWLEKPRMDAWLGELTN